jgi:hypothetical protein
MRVVISAVVTGVQLTGISCGVNATVRHLLALPAVSSVCLLVNCRHAFQFDQALRTDDRRLEILPVFTGRSRIASYIWHYRTLPEIAAKLRADLVHLSYPVPTRVASFFPATAFSLQRQHQTDTGVTSGPIGSLLERCILKQCLKAMGETAWISKPLQQQLGLDDPKIFDRDFPAAHHTEAYRREALTNGG